MAINSGEDLQGLRVAVLISIQTVIGKPTKGFLIDRASKIKKYWQIRKQSDCPLNETQKVVHYSRNDLLGSKLLPQFGPFHQTTKRKDWLQGGQNAKWAQFRGGGELNSGKVPKGKKGSRVVLLRAVMILFCGGAHSGTSEEKCRMGQFSSPPVLVENR